MSTTQDLSADVEPQRLSSSIVQALVTTIPAPVVPGAVSSSSTSYLALGGPGTPGAQGPQGPKGDPGDSGGGGGGDTPFIFVQSSPANPWHIVHGRGSKPSIVIVRQDGVTIDGFGVTYPDDNTVDVYVGLIAGQATLNF